MANVNTRFSLTVVDELGTEASGAFYANLPDTVTLANLKTAWQSLADVVDPVTGAKVIRGHVDLITAMSGGKGSPDAGSRVEQTGVFNFGTASTNHRFGEAIAALSDSKIASGKINLADTDVAAFVTFILAAVAGGTWTNAAGQALTGAIDAVISFRKRRKQLSRSSFELG